MKQKSTNRSKPSGKQPSKKPAPKKKPASKKQNAETKELRERGLTEKEARFCVFYCERYNATQAAIRAGYSPHTATEIGYENLRKPHIKAEIDRLKENFEDLIAEMGITKAGIIAEHVKIAYSSIASYHNTWVERKAFENLPEEALAAISEIDSKIEPKLITMPDGKTKTVKMEYVRVKLYDKQKALDAIAKIMGWNAPEKVDLSTKGEKIQTVVTFIDEKQKALHDKLVESLKGPTDKK